MSGAVEGVARIKLDADGEAMVCTGCGTTRTVAAIVAGSATAFTCCPERKMIPARTMWHAWCDANDARPALTTPPARSYADGVEDAAKIVEDGYRCRTCSAVFIDTPSDIRGGHPDNGCRYPNWDRLTEQQQVAAIRLLSQGGKA